MTIARLIEDLIKAGTAPALVGRVVQALTDVAAPPMVPDSLEKRRAYDRERKRKLPDNWSAIRLAVFERDGYVCTYCGEAAPNPHCDHIHPLARGGSSETDNLATACPRCNLLKGDYTLEEWKAARS